MALGTNIQYRKNIRDVMAKRLIADYSATIQISSLVISVTAA